MNFCCVFPPLCLMHGLLKLHFFFWQYIVKYFIKTWNRAFNGRCHFWRNLWKSRNLELWLLRVNFFLFLIKIYCLCIGAARKCDWHKMLWLPQRLWANKRKILHVLFQHAYCVMDGKSNDSNALIYLITGWATFGISSLKPLDMESLAIVKINFQVH